VRRHRWTTAATLVVLLAACSGGAGDADGGDPGTATPAPQEDRADPSDDRGAGATPPPSTDGSGPEVPSRSDDDPLAFSGRLLAGGSFDGATLSGDVILWFWTPW
jgi:hypothetical protein